MRQRSELLKSRCDSAPTTVSLNDERAPMVRARSRPARVSSGIRPFGGSTINDVRNVLTGPVPQSNQKMLYEPVCPCRLG